MKIILLGSMSIAPIIKKTKEKLEKNGFEVLVSSDLDHIIANPHLPDDLDADYKHCVENDIQRDFFDKIADSDVVLALNYPKNGIDGYCGTSVLMELGLAYYLRKKIYLLNPLPNYYDHRWALEVAILRPTVIDGDITKVTL
ncbi:MAG TPA: hypothetical protein VMR18_02960 [Candidatus Saccharimonadales bacterium]|nr:hypothetical protein [Candidatus Saccharimonadales bacterium]